MKDPLGAFHDPLLQLHGATSGPLAGLCFAAKDVFDVAGHRTGAGNPDWLRTHPPARFTASAIQRLLDAGASLHGKTHTDELTFSLNGENFHYGTPLNPAAPGRIPGGSSSGSASAVAGRLVDFALGTDTGGSVRLPASECGIPGFRPTWGAVPNDHVLPLAPSFDTVGWFARDAGLLERVGQVLLPAVTWREKPKQLLLATDTFERVFEELRADLSSALARITACLGPYEEVAVYEGESAEWVNGFRTLQGLEIWATHGDWIRQTGPVFGPEIRDRFEWASSLDPATAPEAESLRARARGRLDQLLGKDRVLCLPSSPSIAPPMNMPGPDLESFRVRALALLCIAGLAGLPQVSLPLARFNGFPLGLSLVGPRHSDLGLLRLAHDIMQGMPPQN